MDQMQNQVTTLTSKLDQMEAAQKAAAAPAPEQAQNSGKKAKQASHRSSAADKRYQQLEARLTEEQKQLAETREQVAQNRADLEGNISSTRDELTGSIARTHEELVALEKRGERSYFEFDLTKSKQFERVGPLMLSLRKADAKHRHYDLAMIVDDDRLDKKKVNLYEPVWIHTENESQPVQVVVNKIRKNGVHGYVSAPKYRPADLAAGASSRAPAHANAPDAAPNPQNGHPQDQPAPPQQPDRPAQPAEPAQPQQPAL
jgi:chromosome segregation ATPase